MYEYFGFKWKPSSQGKHQSAYRGFQRRSRGKGTDDTYTAYLEDENFGKCDIVYEDNIEAYMVNVEFRKTGHTRLILESPDGTKKYYDLDVERHSYEIKESTENNG